MKKEKESDTFMNCCEFQASTLMGVTFKSCYENIFVNKAGL